MTETIQHGSVQHGSSPDLIVIAEAIGVIDKALTEIGGRQLVSSTEIRR